jgi:hypothetical protein
LETDIIDGCKCRQVFTHSSHYIVKIFLNQIDTCLKTPTSAIRLLILPLTVVEHRLYHYEHQLYSISFNCLFLNSPLGANHLPSPSSGLQQSFVPAICISEPAAFSFCVCLCVHAFVVLCSCVCVFLFSCRKSVLFICVCLSLCSCFYVCDCVFVCFSLSFCLCFRVHMFCFVCVRAHAFLCVCS